MYNIQNQTTSMSYTNIRAWSARRDVGHYSKLNN